jgi:hypothetical protein
MKKHNKKPIKRTPLEIQQQIDVEHKIDKIPFLQEEKKVQLKKMIVSIVRRQHRIFRNPDCIGAKVYAQIEYQKILKTINNNCDVTQC